MLILKNMFFSKQSSSYDEIKIFTPFGIRFWDPVLHTPVIDGLKVTIEREKGPGPVREAGQTKSGNYSFFNIPGLHHLEYNNDPVDIAAFPKKKYIIHINDKKERYSPVLFRIELPFNEKGLFPLNLQENTIESFPEDIPPEDFFPSLSQFPGFYLFSSPVRQKSPGIAVVRACLKDFLTDKPAAYALMQVSYENTSWYGIAGKDGIVAVFLPYPVFKASLSTSPDAVTGLDPKEQNWEVTTRVFYTPSVLEFYKDTSIPFIKTIFNQSPAGIWKEEPVSPVPAPETEVIDTLTFNKDLILKTEGLSEMLIQESESS